jgi:O-antigen ligase
MASVQFGLCALTIICSLLLGGSTRPGFLSDVLLQYFSLPLLFVSLWRLTDIRASSVPKRLPFKWELVLCGAVLLVPLVQLLPLPPAVWSLLPNRQSETFVFELAGGQPPWMPISVSPEVTWLGFLGLLPPVAVFIGCLLLNYRERRLMSLVILSVGLASVFLGLLQVAQGPSSPLRFFEVTNPTEAVGFFANRNHFAALLYVLALLAAAWAIDASFRRQGIRGRNRYDASAVIAVLASFITLIVLISAQAMARSRAGIGLTALAVFGAFAMAYLDRRSLGLNSYRAHGSLPTKVLLAASLLSILFSVQFTLYRVLERFAAFDPLEDSRTSFAITTSEAAKAYMPVGAGVGAFVPVYAMYEKLQDVLVNGYVNHAHDDVLELWLETGLGGLILMGVFSVWLAVRSARIWRRQSFGALDIDQSLARAATLIIGLLFAHSFVEYPLRTDAMMAMLAFACALLLNPSPDRATDRKATISGSAEKIRRRGAPRAEVPAAAWTRSRSEKPMSGVAAATLSPWLPAEVFEEEARRPGARPRPAK